MWTQLFNVIFDSRCSVFQRPLHTWSVMRTAAAVGGEMKKGWCNFFKYKLWHETEINIKLLLCPLVLNLKVSARLLGQAFHITDPSLSLLPLFSLSSSAARGLTVASFGAERARHIVSRRGNLTDSPLKHHRCFIIAYARWPGWSDKRETRRMLICANMN